MHTKTKKKIKIKRKEKDKKKRNRKKHKKEIRKEKSIIYIYMFCFHIVQLESTFVVEQTRLYTHTSRTRHTKTHTPHEDAHATTWT
jgi:hypothetical protein